MVRGKSFSQVWLQVGLQPTRGQTLAEVKPKAFLPIEGVRSFSKEYRNGCKVGNEFNLRKP
jgi:hypothetical protein